MRKKSQLICGVGVNDSPTPIMKEVTIDGKRKTVWRCPFYTCWLAMITRCYSQYEKKRNPSYLDCLTVPEWVYFSNFKAWMEKQDWQDKALDKDLLIPGNKLYGPDTCVFIDARVNNFIVEKSPDKKSWPTGVSYSKSNNKFKSQCCDVITGEQKYLGYYDSAKEAHEIWLKYKLEQAKILASMQRNPKVAKALISRYENYKILSD